MRRILLISVLFLPLTAYAQNSALAPEVRPTFFNASGTVAGNGFLCTTQTGTSTSLLTYQDSALTLPNQNPIHLNGVGRAVNGSNEVSIYIQAQKYRFSIYAAGNANTCNGNPVGALLNQIDNVYDLALLYQASFATQLDDQICHASQYTGSPNDAGGKIAACITALPSTGGIVDARGLQGPQTISTNIFNGVTKPVTLMLGAATYSISVAQTVAANRAKVMCQGTTMTQVGTIVIWTFTGTDQVIDGCQINGSGSTGGQIINMGGTRTIASSNTITAYGLPAIFISNATDSRVINNTVLGGSGSQHGIQTGGGSGPVNGVIIQGNRIDIPSTANVNSKPIELISANAGSDIGNLTVSGNVLSTALNFCLEVGAFDGSNPNNFVHDVTASGNTCTATANSAGGYSAGSGAKSIIFANNVYNAAGFTISIAGLEFGGGVGFAFTGNTIRNASAVATPILLSQSCEDGVISGNTIIGFSTAAIDLSVSTAVPIRKITISNNVIEFSAGVAGTGIWVQCNNASATCRNMALTGNTILGDGTANGVGINLEIDAGVMENITVSGNTIWKINNGIQLSGAGTGGINGLSVTSNTYDAANTASSFGINGTALLANFNISNNTFTSLNAGAVAYTINYGIYLSGANSDGTVSNNQINGISTTLFAQSGIRLLNSAASTLQRVTVSGNTVNAHGGGADIFLHCTNAGGTCQDVFIENNNVVGDGTSGSYGIEWATSGTASRVAVLNNKIQNVTNCVNGSNIASHVMNNVFANCTTTLGGLGSSVLVMDYNGIILTSVPSLANGSMVYVTDSTIANPCTGGGTGAILKRLNGVNVCN